MREVNGIFYVGGDRRSHEGGEVFHGIGQRAPFLAGEVNGQVAKLSEKVVDPGDVVGVRVGKDDGGGIEVVFADVADHLA